MVKICWFYEILPYNYFINQSIKIDKFCGWNGDLKDLYTSLLVNVSFYSSWSASHEMSQERLI